MRKNSSLHQDMFRYYKSWQESGLSQIGFSILNGITFHKFNYWVGKFDSGNTKGKASVLTVVGGRVVYGAGKYSELSPKLGDVLPSWSPIKYFGGYHFV